MYRCIDVDNARIYVRFGVTFIMFFDIYFLIFYPSYEGFSVTAVFNKNSFTKLAVSREG